MRTHLLSWLLVSVCLMSVDGAANKWEGVNLSGGEFGSCTNGPTCKYGFQYIFPSNSEIDYFVNKGMNLFRIPFKWERLQYNASQAFDTAEQNRLVTVINYITITKNTMAIIDPHNYGKYYGKQIGKVGSGVTNDDFKDLWIRLANLFKNNYNVIFGLMNEPVLDTTEQWRDAAKAAIVGIRSTGATNLIFVPGNGYTGVQSWFSTWYGNQNAIVMVGPNGINDFNFMFELHAYFDSDSSGTHETCSTANCAPRFASVTTWARTNGVKLFVGEIAGANNTACRTCLTNAFTHMTDNPDVWVAWTWWGAGPWWPSDYMFLIEPKNGVDAPQFSWLTPFLPATGPVGSGAPGSIATIGSSSAATSTTADGIPSSETSSAAVSKDFMLTSSVILSLLLAASL